MGMLWMTERSEEMREGKRNDGMPVAATSSARAQLRYFQRERDVMVRLCAFVCRERQIENGWRELKEKDEEGDGGRGGASNGSRSPQQRKRRQIREERTSVAVRERDLKV